MLSYISISMVNYEKIVAVNSWWSQGVQFKFNDPDLTKVRSIAAKFERKTFPLSMGEIHVIKGPKRIGKTVWIKDRIAAALDKNEFSKRDIFYFSFDDVRSDTEFRNMLHWFMEEQPHEGNLLLFLDEVQNVNNWQNVLKTLYDNGSFKRSCVIITGSLAHALELDELVGRVKESNIFLMRPVTFARFMAGVSNARGANNRVMTVNQYLNYNTTDSAMADLLEKLNTVKLNLSSSPKEWKKAVDYLVPHIPLLNRFLSLYVRTGGYPLIISQWLTGVSHRTTELNNAYSDIYTYTKNDAALVATGRPRDPLKAGKVLDTVLKHFGQKISNAQMSRDAELDPMTFASYFKRLQSSFAFLSLKGTDNKLTPMLINKTYFADVAMHYAVGASYHAKNVNDFIEETLQSSQIGSIIEEVVAQHLVQIRETGVMKQYGGYLRFMRFQSEKEIDFIYTDEQDSNVAIEVKYQNNVNSHDLIESSEVHKYLIITKDDLAFDENVALIPVAIFLALLPASVYEM